MKDAVLKNICRNYIYYKNQKAKHPYKSHFGLYKICGINDNIKYSQKNIVNQPFSPR